MGAVFIVANLAAGFLDFSWENEVDAAQSTAALSVVCVDPVVVSFVPNASYNLTFPAASQATAPNLAAIAVASSLSQNVNSDSNPNVTHASNPASKIVRFYHRGPYIKIGGVQCSTNSSATLAIHGDGVNDTQYDIAVESASSTAWAAGNQVDQLTGSNPAMIYGSGGLLGTSPLSDGSDSDGILNGEIAFGGESGGGSYRLFNSVQFLNISDTSHSETLTYVFTPN